MRRVALAVLVIATVVAVLALVPEEWRLPLIVLTVAAGVTAPAIRKAREEAPDRSRGRDDESGFG